MVVVVGGGERVFCALFNTEVDSALAAFACTSAPRRTPGLEAPTLATGGERKRLGDKEGYVYT